MNCISLWYNTAWLSHSKCKFCWRHIENCVAVTPPPRHTDHQATKPPIPTLPNRSVSLLWGSVLQTKRISGPYRSWNRSRWEREPVGLGAQAFGSSGFQGYQSGHRAPATSSCLYRPVRVCTMYIVLTNILMTIGIFIEFMQKLQILLCKYFYTFSISFKLFCSMLCL